MSSVLNRRTRLAVLAATGLYCLDLTSCGTLDSTSATAPVGGSDGAGSAATRDGGRTAEAAVQVPPVAVTSNVAKGATSVPVDTLLTLAATGGELKRVTVTAGKALIAGRLAPNGRSWKATQRLEPGTAYTVRTAADNGERITRTRSAFSTEALTLDQQTYPSLSPLPGSVVGVGMPVIVSFDVPVTDRAAFEKNMHVTTVPAQRGSWHWLSDNLAHWRPAAYFKPGTEVDVDVDVNGVDAGHGIYGQEDRHTSFTVGDAHVYKVNAQTHQMQVFSNGKLLRTIPITTGKPGYTTRSGTKVIIEKFESKRMNSETVGIGGSEAYDIDDVRYAMRMTYSGEFIHAAPWSVGSQGYANVSHGCTGMSTENAAWLFAMTRVGDVVETVGTDRPMTLDNGYGDWNESFAEWSEGSALA